MDQLRKTNLDLSLPSDFRQRLGPARKLASLGIVALAAAAAVTAANGQSHRWWIASIGLGLLALTLAGRWTAEFPVGSLLQRELIVENTGLLSAIGLGLLLGTISDSPNRNLALAIVAVVASTAGTLRSLALNGSRSLLAHQVFRSLALLTILGLGIRLIAEHPTRSAVILAASMPILLAHLSLANSAMEGSARVIAPAAIGALLIGVSDRIELVIFLVAGGLICDVLVDSRRSEDNAGELPALSVWLWLTAVAATGLLAVVSSQSYVGAYLAIAGVVLVAYALAGSIRIDWVQNQLLLQAESDLRELRIVAELDDLTGLPMRSAMRRRMNEEVERAVRYRQPMCVLFIDVDHFKEVNDSFGHVVGDKVLATIGQTIRSVVRTPDFVARFGGEEFVVIAPGTWSEDAAVLALRLQVAIAEVTLPELPVMPTISIGIAGVPEHGAATDVVLARADHAMYTAKFGGRNRIEIETISEPDTPG